MKHVFLALSLLLVPAFAVAGGYKGKPFKQHRVPCTVEAEDYDRGGEGMAFHCKNNSSGDRRAYRIDPVNIASGGSGLVLGGNDDGNWTCYTLYAAESGMYSVGVVCSSGVDNGRFELRVDGRQACRVQRVPGRGWESYSTVTVGDIPLKKGRHVFQWYTYGGMNVDKFVFTRTGDYVKGALPGRFDYDYPMTQRFGHNPLFLSFPSQMYGSPFTGNLYTADPTARVWHIDGRDVLYVYASHDMEPARGCDRMDRYHVFSTEDMVNWTDHGEILNADDVRRQTGIGTEGFMWAPDAAYNEKDGLYYFLFPHTEKITLLGDDEDLWRMFMATSESPAGPFKVQGYIPGVPSTIDPCIFVDDDGTAYVYAGGGGKGCWGGRLKDDNWLELAAPMVPMEGVSRDFHEAPFVFKKDGRYYLTHSDNNPNDLGGNHLVYAVSDSPLGPWKDMGFYMNPHGHETAHGSVVQFKGKWYQFYHTADYSGQGNLRSVCFDELTFTPDGRINTVRTWGTPKGGRLPMLMPGGRLVIEAEDYNDGGLQAAWFKRPDNQTFTLGDAKFGQMSVKADGGTGYIASMERGEWARYSLFVACEGTYRVTLRMRPSSGGGSKFRFGVDGVWTGRDELPVGSPAGEWGETVVSGIHLTPGEHYFEWRGARGTVDVDRIVIEADKP